MSSTTPTTTRTIGSTTGSTDGSTNGSATEPAVDTPRTAMSVAGALALITGPVAFVAGMFTSPDQDGESSAAYVEALARDELLTQVSALLLHYGNLLMAFGFLAAPLLVRGRRGYGLTVAGALASALAFANQSGALLSDWWIMHAGRMLELDQAVAVSEATMGSPLLHVWFGTELLCAVGPLLLLAGLARAGVTSWWLLPWLAGGVVLGFAFGSTQPLLLAALLLVALAPLALVGVRLLQRVRAGVA